MLLLSDVPLCSNLPPAPPSDGNCEQRPHGLGGAEKCVSQGLSPLLVPDVHVSTGGDSRERVLTWSLHFALRLVSDPAVFKS